MELDKRLKELDKELKALEIRRLSCENPVELRMLETEESRKNSLYAAMKKAALKLDTITSRSEKRIF